MAITAPKPIWRAILEHRQRLDLRDRSYQRQLAVQYAGVLEALNVEQQRLARVINDAIARGTEVKPTWLNQQARYLSLQAQTYRRVAEFGEEAFSLVSEAHRAATRLAVQQGQVEATAQAGLPGAVDPRFAPDSWAVVNRRAVEMAMGFLSSADQPLQHLLTRDLGETAVAALRQTWGRGIALGHNPNRIARAATRAVGTLSLGRAQLIARTEFHRAYREAKRVQFSESPVVGGWTWRSALDGRTCAICYSMHGTEFPATETLESHPNCRCVMIPKTKSWEELGFPGMEDTRPQFERGDDLFNRLPEDAKLRMLGPTRYKMHQDGLPLREMIGTSTNPIWGRSRGLLPLSHLPGYVPKNRKTGGSDAPPAAPAGAAPKVPWKVPDDVSINQLRKSAPGFLDHTPDEQHAIRSYRGGSYETYNDLGRGLLKRPEGYNGKAYYDPADERIGTYWHMRKVVRDLDAVIRRYSFAADTVTYRGVGGKFAETCKNLRPGATIKDGGFVSTTTDVRMAASFASKQGVVFRVVNKAGQNAHVTTSAPKQGKERSLPSESEVILPRGTEMRVVDVHTETIKGIHLKGMGIDVDFEDMTVVTVEVIGSSAVDPSKLGHAE